MGFFEYVIQISKSAISRIEQLTPVITSIYLANIFASYKIHIILLGHLTKEAGMVLSLQVRKVILKRMKTFSKLT